jgi:hypothetical protein
MLDRSGIDCGADWSQVSEGNRADWEAAANGAADWFAGMEPPPQLAALAAREPGAADGAALRDRKRLRMLLADTPFEFRPDWAPEYEDETGDIRDLAEPQPAPELAEDDPRDVPIVRSGKPEVRTTSRPGEALAAENATLRAILTEVLGWFSDNGSGRYARVSGTVLARAYAKSPGLTVPEELRRYL